MSAFKEWIIRQDVDPFDLTLEDAFDAGRQSVIKNCKDESYSIIFSRMDREIRELKIRFAGVLNLLRADGIITYSKMLQLSDMTDVEIAKAIAKIEVERK